MTSHKYGESVQVGNLPSAARIFKVVARFIQLFRVSRVTNYELF